MGSVESQIIVDNDKGSEFIEQLRYQVQQDSKIFGRVKIYRHHISPFPYFLKASLSLASNDPNTIHKINLLKNLMKHDNNVQLNHLKIIKNNQICGQSTKIQFFCKYYAYTVEDAILLRNKNEIFQKQTTPVELSNNRKQNDILTDNIRIQHIRQKQQMAHRLGNHKFAFNNFGEEDILTISLDYKTIKENYFVQGDIWYALCSLVSYAKAYIESFNCQFGKFKIRQIFLSPEGFIKIYQFLHLFEREQFSCCAQQSRETKNSSIFMTERQVMLPIRQRKSSKGLQYFQKSSDIFDIGIIVLSLISLQDLSNLQTKPSKYTQIANILNKIQNLNIYDFRLIDILKKMLLPHSERITLDQLMMYLPQLKSKQINYRDRKAVERFLNENSSLNHRFTMHKPQTKFIVNTIYTETGHIKNDKISQNNTSILNKTPQIDPFSIETPQQIKYVKQNKYI